jgi:broad specificity phosphatase PhoE
MRRVPHVRVHLVRHGEVENPDHIRYGRLPGFHLSARGREQAARAAEYLARQHPPIALVVSSPLERARETADVIARRLGLATIRCDDRLTEAASRLDGLPRAFGLHRSLGRHATRLWRGAFESPKAIANRMCDALASLAADAEREGQPALVVVSHQLPIQYARHLLARQSAAAWLDRARWRLGWVPKPRCDHASITTVTFDGVHVRSIEYVEP